MLDVRATRRFALPSQPLPGEFAAQLSLLASRSLYREVALPLKPGLVGPFDSGSHTDMDFHTFVRSIKALRPHFSQIARCGANDPTMAELQALGIRAESAMLAATGGVNTHRGAIFNIGLLVAAVAWLASKGRALVPEQVCAVVREQWGDAILARVRNQAPPNTHGESATQRYGVGGARAEAASAFVSVREIGLPVYRQTLHETGDATLAASQTLFSLVANTDDTNLLWRGGLAGLQFAQHRAQGFLAAGGVYAPDWREHAAQIHQQFVTKRLSPGGSADLLAATLFLSELG